MTDDIVTPLVPEPETLLVRYPYLTVFRARGYRTAALILAVYLVKL